MLKQWLLPNQGAYSEPEAGSVFIAILEAILLLVETQTMTLNLLLESFFF